MKFFTSDRERRLWLLTLAVVVAIYSTLGLVGPLAKALRNSDLLGVFFGIGMLLVIATIVSIGLKARPGGAEIGVFLGIIAAYLMVFVRMALPEERTHLIEYSVVAIFIHEALKERVSQGRHVPLPAIVAILAASLVGVFDECIQAFLPSRVFDPRDILFNVLASVMAVSGSLALTWVRQRTKK